MGAFSSCVKRTSRIGVSGSHPKGIRVRANASRRPPFERSPRNSTLTSSSRVCSVCTRTSSPARANTERHGASSSVSERDRSGPRRPDRAAKRWILPGSIRPVRPSPRRPWYARCSLRWDTRGRVFRAEAGFHECAGGRVEEPTTDGRGAPNPEFFEVRPLAPKPREGIEPPGNGSAVRRINHSATSARPRAGTLGLNPSGRERARFRLAGIPGRRGGARSVARGAGARPIAGTTRSPRPGPSAAHRGGRPRWRRRGRTR
jgi:hypothetical protein